MAKAMHFNQTINEMKWIIFTSWDTLENSCRWNWKTYRFLPFSTIFHHFWVFVDFATFFFNNPFEPINVSHIVHVHLYGNRCRWLTYLWVCTVVHFYSFFCLPLLLIRYDPVYIGVFLFFWLDLAHEQVVENKSLYKDNNNRHNDTFIFIVE